LNIKLGNAEIPVVGILAVLGTFGMLVIVLWTHEFARVIGPPWIVAWLVYYIWYRRSTKRPVFRSLQRDWDAHQLEILADTGEWELYEQFRNQVERKKRISIASPVE
jgi:hypothetical protein